MSDTPDLPAPFLLFLFLFCRDDNVQKELRDWGLSFESKLLSFSGRVVQSEKIRQGGKAVGNFSFLKRVKSPLSPQKSKQVKVDGLKRKERLGRFVKC